VYTAKEVSTLDWLSGGRVDLGVGVGWLEEEFEAVNVPWAQRGRRTDEYLEVLTTLWCDETSAYQGEFYSLDPCSMFPKPVQQPHPPIHFGGESRAALSRVARAGQGWHTFNRAPDQLAEPLGTLDGLLAQQGRSRSDVTVTVCPYFQPLDADRVARYTEAGADAVSALILPLGVDAVRTALDDLQPVFDRAARS
jgi:probable F420-dependent oxidoreductase